MSKKAVAISQTRGWQRFALLSLIMVSTMILSACGGGSEDSSGGIEEPDSSSSDGTASGTVRIGNGVGSGFEEGVVRADVTDIFSGQSATLRVSVVDGSGLPVSQTVTLNSPCISNNQSFTDASAGDTGDDGSIEFVYTAASCTGADIVTAATTGVSGEQITASVTINVTAVAVIGLQYVESTVEQLTLPGIGGNESSEVSFRVVGEFGGPVFGEEVTFELDSDVGGVRLAEGSDTDTSDEEGIVKTTVLAGTVPTTLSVRATHTATGIISLSGDLSISTGVPADGRISISVSELSPESTNTSDGVEVEVTMSASDMLGNYVPDNTRITFVSPEFGSIGSSCLTKDGKCSVTWTSAGENFPANGRTTMLAYTDGAESFTDNNGNNIYDAADTFDLATHDKGEPYADTNENGAYDVGEFFVDGNNNGVRDVGDGVWNGPCLIATNPAAVCSDLEQITIGRMVTLELVTETAVINALGTFPAVGSNISLAAGEVSFGGMLISDENGHTLQGGSTLSFELIGQDPLPTLDGDDFTVNDESVGPQGPLLLTIIPPDGADGTRTATLVLRVTYGVSNQKEEIGRWVVTF